MQPQGAVSQVGTKADMVVIFMSVEDVKYSDLCTRNSLVPSNLCTIL